MAGGGLQALRKGIPQHSAYESASMSYDAGLVGLSEGFWFQALGFRVQRAHYTTYCQL